MWANLVNSPSDFEMCSAVGFIRAISTIFNTEFITPIFWGDTSSVVTFHVRWVTAGTMLLITEISAIIISVAFPSSGNTNSVVTLELVRTAILNIAEIWMLIR